MRQEEVRANQHIGKRQINIRDPQARMLDLLRIGKLEAFEWRDIRLDSASAKSTEITRVDNAGRIWLDAGALGGTERQHGTRCAGIKQHSNLGAVHIGGSGGARVLRGG